MNEQMNQEEEIRTCGCHSEDEHDHEHHDHHHDHDHDHHHDHEHDHHHDHEHHDHDHDHDHDHHHHHDHEHGHQYEIPGYRIFETHSHEGATICSFEKDSTADKAQVTTAMEQCINTLERWLDETDATIGHVKGYVRESGPVTTFSTVGCGLNIEEHGGQTLSIGFASIVFGPTEEELKDKVAEIFAF